MGLEISTIVTLGTACDEVMLLDSTGIYDITLNPTGWGTPNPATSDITAAVLTVTEESSGAIYTYDFTTDVADYLSGGLTITSLVLFGIATAPDGYYTYLVTLTVSGTDYEYSSPQAFFCKGKCCMLKQLANIKFPLVEDQKAFADLEEMFIEFFGMYWASCCGNADRFVTLINAFNEKCNSCGTPGVISSSSSGSCCGS
jgi:hypothetical protein